MQLLVALGSCPSAGLLRSTRYQFLVYDGIELLVKEILTPARWRSFATMSAVFFWLTNTMMGAGYWLLLRISSMRCLYGNRQRRVMHPDSVYALLLLVSVDELDSLLDSVHGTSSLTDGDDSRFLQVLLRQALDRWRHGRGE